MEAAADLPKHPNLFTLVRAKNCKFSSDIVKCGA